MDAVTNAGGLAGALELSEDRQRASVALAGTVGDTVRVDLTDYGITPVEAVQRVQDLARRYRVGSWAVDPASPAAALLLQLDAVGATLVLPGARDVAAACGVFSSTW